MSSSVQATRLRKGMLIKLGNDLFRILELHHLTPGNKRAHIQCRMRNIRTTTLADHKFRAEEDVERATLDEREMQKALTNELAKYKLPKRIYVTDGLPRNAMGKVQKKDLRERHKDTFAAGAAQ